MKSVMDVVHAIADEARLYDSLSDNEIAELTTKALDLIANFEKTKFEPTSLDLGKACCLLLTLSNDYANHEHWETVENLFSGVEPIAIKNSVLAIRDDYLKEA